MPSGVVTVLKDLVCGWPESDRITILLNAEHWAKDFLRGATKHKRRVDLLEVPSVVSPLWIVSLTSTLPSPIRMMLRLLLFPLLVLQQVFMLFWMIFQFRRKRVDGVLSHNGGWPGGTLNCWALYAAFLAGVRHRVLVIHNTPFVPSNPIRLMLLRIRERVIGCVATRIVTVSNACRESLIAATRLRRLDVIYNGIPAKDPASAAVERKCPPAWNKEYPAVGFVGELHPRKGVHVLMEAFKGIDFPAELVLIGNGDQGYTETLKSMASDSKYPVHFLGFRNDVSALYAHIDILVLPSLDFESFGMVIVEAMRASVPVICSDFGGMKEVVQDGETGMVVPAGSVQALTNALNRLLEDPDWREILGRNGFARLRSHFSVERMVKGYFALFHHA